MRRTINRIMAIMAVAAMAFATGGCVEPLDNNVRGIDPDAVYLPIRLYIPGAIPTTKVSTGDVKGISAESQIHTVQVWMFSHMDSELLTPAEGETPEQAQAREAALAEHAVAYAESGTLTGQNYNLPNGSGYYNEPNNPGQNDQNTLDWSKGYWVDDYTYQIPLVLPKQVLELPAADMKFDFYVLANAPSIGFEAGKTATRGSLIDATFGFVSEDNDDFGTSSPIISIADKGLPISGFFNKGSNGETLASASGVDLSSLRNRTNFTAAELHEILPIVQLERAVSRIRFAFAKPYEGETQNPTQLEITSIEINGELIPTSTFVFPRENGVFELPTPISYVSKAVVTGPKGASFVTANEIQAKSLLDNPEDLKPDSPKVFSDVDNQKSYYNKAPGGNNTTNPETPVMTAQQYSDLLDDYTASKFVYFRESDKVITGKINYKVNGVVQTAKPFSMVLPSDQNYNNFHRNHSWTVYAYLKGGSLWIKPLLNKDWVDASKNPYTYSVEGTAYIAVSDKSQSLFGYGWTTAITNRWWSDHRNDNPPTEWYFRRQNWKNPAGHELDLLKPDGATFYDWGDWVNSQVVVAPGFDVYSGAPLYSNKIELHTNYSVPLILKCDNPSFGFVVYNSTILEDNVGVTYEGFSTVHNEVVIPANSPSDPDRITYFYLVPKTDSDFSNPLAKVSLVTTGLEPVKLPFNSGVFPGSEENSEIYYYYVPEDTFQKYYNPDPAHPTPVPVNIRAYSEGGTNYTDQLWP